TCALPISGRQQIRLIRLVRQKSSHTSLSASSFVKLQVSSHAHTLAPEGSTLLPCAKRLLAHGELPHQVFAHLVPCPRRVADHDHSIGADLHFVFNDVFF